MFVIDYKSIAEIQRSGNNLCCAKLTKEHLNDIKFVVSLK